MQNVVSAWVDSDVIVPGARCRRLRWPAPDGSASVELSFPVLDAAGAIEHLHRVKALVDPAFVSIVDFAVADEQATVRYGGDVDSIGVAKGPMSVGEVVRITDQILAGLEQAHARGFVHPALGPACVRLSTGLDGRVSAQVLGMGLPLDLDRTAADDVTDVATMAYQLATGRHPNQSRDAAGELLPMGVANPGVTPPTSFEQAILRALGEHGFFTATQMRRALVAGDRGRGGARVTVSTLPRSGQAARPRSVDSFVGPLPTAAVEVPAQPLAPAAPLTTPAPAAPAPIIATPIAPAPVAAQPVAASAPAPAPAARTSRGRLVLGAFLLVALIVIVVLLMQGGEGGGKPAGLVAEPGRDAGAEPVRIDAGVAQTAAPTPTTSEATTALAVVPDTTRAPDVANEDVALAAAPDTTVAQDSGEAALALAEVAAPTPAPVLSRLALVTEPAGAEVTEGERALGLTPLSIELGAGRHELSLARDGYEPRTLVIDLLPGGEVTQQISLERIAVAGRRPRRAPREAEPVTANPTPTAEATPPATVTPTTTTPIEPPRPKILGGEVRPKILGQDQPAAPTPKILGQP